MRGTIFQAEIASTPEAAHALLSNVLETLEGRGWIQSQEDRFALWLCLEEALSNAVKHGNKGRADARVTLEASEDGDLGLLSVGDEGGGFDPDSVSMPCCGDLHGRGVCLIKHYMERVVYDRSRRRLVMAYRLRRDGGANGQNGGGNGAVSHL